MVKNENAGQQKRKKQLLKRKSKVWTGLLLE